MPFIQGLFTREIIDGLGEPTIECTIWTDTGFVSASTAPSSTRLSTHAKEQLSDGNYQHFTGNGVLASVAFIQESVAPNLIGKDPLDQEGIDAILTQLAGSSQVPIDPRALLVVSQTVLKLAALVTDTPLYFYLQQRYQLVSELFVPDTIATLVSGGVFGTENLDFAEFLLLPATHLPYPEEINLIYTINRKFREVLISKGAVYATGMTGAFVPNLYANADVFELMIEAVKLTNYTFAQDVFFGITADARALLQRGKYRLKDRADAYSSKELIEYYQKMRELYHTTYLEDTFAEDDPKSWQQLTQTLGTSALVACNRAQAGSVEQIAKLAQGGECNSVVLELPHQGTISEVLASIRAAREQGLKIIVSVADRETNDDFLADFAVGVGSDYFKTSAPNRGENTAKINRLLQIDQEITLQTQ